MDINLTWAGAIALILLFFYIIKWKFNIYRLFSSPIIIILFSFFNYFGKYSDVNFSNENNSLLAFSFCVFIVTFWITQKSKLTAFDKDLIRLPNRVNIYGSTLVSKKGKIFLLSFCIIYIVVDLYLNSIIYGSLYRALLRFYSAQMTDQSYGTIKNLLSFIYKGAIAVLFIYRYYDDVYNKKTRIVNICAVLLFLIAIPRGSRGAMVAPFITLITADIFAKRYFNKSLKRQFKQYILFGFLGISSFLMLTAIRSVKFNSFDDLVLAVKMTSISEGADGYASREGDLMINDTKLCFDKFGKEVSFLSPFYTFNSIMVSFIPRTLYTTKPVSFGFLLNAVKEGKYYSLGQPEKLYYPGAIDWAAGIAGEGYANGGIIGIIFYSVLFGIISGKCSKYYYKLITSKKVASTLLGLLFFQMSASFIRGSLQSTFTPSLYTILLFIIIIKIYLYCENIHCCRRLG